MDLNSRYFKIDADEERITLRFDAPGSLTLTSKSRAKELCHQVKVRFRRWKPLNKSENGATVMIVFCRSDLDQVKKALLDVEYFLDQFSTARLTPRMVEEALGITSLERTRWTKDGRLPRSGTGSFRKGRQLFQFYFYPAREISLLVENPAVVTGWRQFDSQVA